MSRHDDDIDSILRDWYARRWMHSARNAKIMTDVDPAIEAFFVAVMLAHGTNPVPKFGLERVLLAGELTEFIDKHPGQPEIIARVQRNYVELGGLKDKDKMWFARKLADAYLDWLYAQAEKSGIKAEPPAYKDSAQKALDEAATELWRKFGQTK